MVPFILDICYGIILAIIIYPIYSEAINTCVDNAILEYELQNKNKRKQ